MLNQPGHWHLAIISLTAVSLSQKTFSKVLIFNSLWPSDAIWRHRSGSTLAHVMACCLTNQRWLLVSDVLWHSPQSNFTKVLTIVDFLWVRSGVSHMTVISQRMMTSSNGTFSALLAICSGNSPIPGEFPAQRPVTPSLIFSLICVWVNDWVNNREAGDLRRYRAHYGVTVMKCTSYSYV